MKLKPFLLIVITAATLFGSCKKDDKGPNSETYNKIGGRWQIDSIVTNQQINGINFRESLTGINGDYLEFSSDGKMKTHFQGKNEQTSYNVKDATTIIINGDSAYIRELTEHKLTIYTKAAAGPLGFIEITYYLSR